MIEIDQVCKSYGDLKVLDNIDLHVSKGVVHGIVGPNGAGKTTLFKIICGLIEPDSGKTFIRSDKPKKVGAIIEHPSTYEYLSAGENISVFSKVQGVKPSRLEIKKSLELVGLEPSRRDPVKNYSLGMKQRLGIAIALINQPDCLILDEPFLGLDPLGMKGLSELMHHLTESQEITIILSSHLLKALSETCHHLSILRQGKIEQQGTFNEVMESFTLSYVIAGKGIAGSKSLKEFDYTEYKDNIRFKATSFQANQLLKALIREGYDITSFEPETDLNRLYKS